MQKKKIEGLVILPIPLTVSGTSPSPIKIEANRITLSRYFQSANMIENSDVEVTEDECVCSLVTFDDAIPRLS